MNKKISSIFYHSMNLIIVQKMIEYHGIFSIKVIVTYKWEKFHLNIM